MVLNVKAFLEKDGEVKGEIRRFQVDLPSGSTELYPCLSSKVADIFALAPNSFRLYWQDADGDFVTFTSTMELMEAVKHSPNGVLRVFVKRASGKSQGQGQKPGGSSTSSGDAPQEEKVFHPGVTCDGCETPIFGPRYKCVICPDYDLCSACEQKGLHPEHDKFKITHPLTAGGPGGFMPPHFRRWMHRFMRKCHGAGGPCPAGASAPGPASGDGAKPDSKKEEQKPGAGNQGPDDDLLNDVGENIRAFLDPFGIDVSYEVRHDGEKASGSFNLGGKGSGSGGFGQGGFGQGGFGQGGAWSWGMFGNPGGCTRMPHAPKPSSEQAGKKPEEKPKEKAASEEMASEPEVEVPVTMEEEPVKPTTGEAAGNRDASPSASSGDDDWTMLNDRDTVTDGPPQAAGTVPRENIYPNLKVQQAVDMMKSMGFNDDEGWLTNLLATTDGDISRALDMLKLSAEQASKLAE